MDEYVRFASSYDTLLNPFLDGVRRRVTEACVQMNVRKVLDVCCGTGRQGVYLADSGIHCSGVDISLHMLREARAKVFPRVPLVRADGAHLPFTGNSFDAGIISFALHEKPLAVAEAILLETFRVASVCLIVDYTLAERNLELPSQWLMQVPERLVGGEHWRHYRAFMKAGAMQGMLHRTGVRVTAREQLFGGGASLFVCSRKDV